MLRILAVVSFLVCCQASILPRLDGRIVGGSSADISEAPYQVSLMVDSAGTGVYTHSCGGTIIRRTVILTAAHCAESTSAFQWQVRAGSTFASSGGQVVNVKSIINHLDYNIWLDNDIALFILETPLETGLDVDLPEQGATVNDAARAFVTGWGSTEEGGPMINDLQKITIPIVNQNICRDLYIGINVVTKNMICAGIIDNGGQDACSGDSGGPLIVDGRLIGITSWGQGCGRPGYPGVWTRVPAYINWINKQLALL